jgi:hypothetical protein
MLRVVVIIGAIVIAGYVAFPNEYANVASYAKMMAHQIAVGVTGAYGAVQH